MSAMKLVCISPEGALYQWEIQKVTLPTPHGTVTILPWHYNMITTMRKWTIDIWPVVQHTTALQDFQDDKISFPVEHGFCLVGEKEIHLSVE